MMPAEQLTALTRLYGDMHEPLLELGRSLSPEAMVSIVGSLVDVDAAGCRKIVIDMVCIGLLERTGPRLLAPAGRN